MGRALGLTESSRYVHEPDNVRKSPFALRAMRSLGRCPVLAPADEAPLYERLWDQAFTPIEDQWGFLSRTTRAFRVRTAKRLLEGAPRTTIRSILYPSRGKISARLRVATALSVPRMVVGPTSNLIVKSVAAMMTLEWIVERWQPKVLIVLRHPLNILASWIDLGLEARVGEESDPLATHPRVQERYLERWGTPLLGGQAKELARAAWRVGLLATVLEETAEQHPDWHIVTHESLCSDPVRRIEGLCADLGLEWTEAVEQYLVDSNRPGTGYQTNRVAAELPERWRARLSTDQIRDIRNVLAVFPMRTWPLGR